MPQAIVIGFVGGFVKSNDQKHREVQFAAHIRESYPRSVYAEVFGNHDGARAFKQILLLLDFDHDGVLTASEKRQAKIILYGHSWGASEMLTLARKLEREQIPVQLAIEIDRIRKPGEGNSSIPSNVARAINFYQSHGLLHGSQEIHATDPARTEILGNFQMSYKNHPIDCDAFPWYARMFMRPHIEIENDPRVWDRIGSLVDAELTATKSTVQLPMP